MVSCLPRHKQNDLKCTFRYAQKREKSSPKTEHLNYINYKICVHRASLIFIHQLDYPDVVRFHVIIQIFISFRGHISQEKSCSSTLRSEYLCSACSHFNSPAVKIAEYR